MGEDERTITTIDADGVALAAIQALNEVVKEKESALELQQKWLWEQSILVRQLGERLEILEKAVEK